MITSMAWVASAANPADSDPAAALTALTADIPTRTAADQDRLRHYASLWLENRSDSTAAHHAYRALLTLLGCTEPGAAAVHWMTLADASRGISGGRTNLAMTALAAVVAGRTDAEMAAVLGLDEDRRAEDEGVTRQSWITCPSCTGSGEA
ncbi:hypothetical protein [Streptomyces cacaoi]|uniref:hypothetical protein n=1 Tax=Streptomyces cacaoi TaxID=1898 RepID=UPI002608995D|nr:hypothetical protein [Streptomyces cacaoi]